jgi:predicted MFS family arabinose efflux permease
VCVALVGPALAHSLATLALALLVLGAAGGLLDVSMNAQAVAIERGYGRPIMSSFHGLWSVGTLLGSAASAAVAAAGVGLLVHFGVAAVLLGALGLVGLRGLLGPEAEQPAEVRERERRARVPWTPVMVWLGLIAFASFLGEGSALDWSAVYLKDNLGAGAGLAATGLVAFALAMSASRFAADGLVGRRGPRVVVRAGATIAGVGLGLGLLVHEPWSALLGFALLGLGLAPVVPVVFSAAGNLDVRSTGVVLGRVVTTGYLGSIVGPIAIGFLSESIGLRAALLLPVLLCFGIALSARAIPTRER